LAIIQFPLRLVAARMIAPAVRHMVFERADGQPFAFIPGQFIQVHFSYADGQATKRSYSIGTVAADAASPIVQIEIAVSYVDGGAATELLGGLAVGGTVDASGPYGRFCLLPGDSNARYVLVATGTGITPYRAMLPLMRRLIAERGCRFELIQGARNEAELLYGDEFAAFAEATPGFGFHPCFSREPRAVPRPGDYAGRVQVAIEALQPDAATDVFYLCGNPDMVDQSFALLKDAGFAVSQIRREKYISSR